MPVTSLREAPTTRGSLQCKCRYVGDGVLLHRRAPLGKSDSWLVDLGSAVACSVTQLCLTLCDPVDCSPPGSSVHGILQARVLEWVAMPSSRGSS